MCVVAPRESLVAFGNLLVQSHVACGSHVGISVGILKSHCIPIGWVDGFQTTVKDKHLVPNLDEVVRRLVGRTE